MMRLATWQAALLGVVLVFAATLLVVWWRQQSYRWALMLGMTLVLAPALSWWSSQVFVVPDYRAGCTGLCAGYRGAPVATFAGETAGGDFLPLMFVVNSLIYLVLLLGWFALLHAILTRMEAATTGRAWTRLAVVLFLLAVPTALAPLYLPPPEAQVRGDPLRVAINARREVYMYDQLAALPILRVGLEDVRPRIDGQPGMRVCLRTYTAFYWPTGLLYLDMAPEGVHSTNGGVLPRAASCWDG